MEMISSRDGEAIQRPTGANWSQLEPTGACSHSSCTWSMHKEDNHKDIHHVEMEYVSFILSKGTGEVGHQSCGSGVNIVCCKSRENSWHHQLFEKPPNTALFRTQLKLQIGQSFQYNSVEDANFNHRDDRYTFRPYITLESRTPPPYEMAT